MNVLIRNILYLGLVVDLCLEGEVAVRGILGGHGKVSSVGSNLKSFIVSGLALIRLL